MPKPASAPPTPAYHLSQEEARGLILAAQSLFELPATQPDAASVQAMIEQLGVVQIDTITVVERSQYLVLWSRLGSYAASDLDALLYPGRTIMEYWSHAASILPFSDYPYYRRAMLDRQARIVQDEQSWLRENPTVIEATREEIRQRGPLASADFERPVGVKRPGPWDWYGVKESRRALEILWMTGELMVHSRRGGQKVYDLRERVLAEWNGPAFSDDQALPTRFDYLDYFLQRTIAHLGFVSPDWLLDYYRLMWLPGGGIRAAARPILEQLQREELLLPVTVDDLAGPFFIHRSQLVTLEHLRQGAQPTHTTLLSPFDSLIWDRKRAQTLFNYEVCFEAYVVPAKRRYGYYCLAILHRGQIVGRIDPKMDRASRTLIVRTLHLEPGTQPDAELATGLATALRDLARFLGAEQVRIERGEATALVAQLRDTLAY